MFWPCQTACRMWDLSSPTRDGTHTPAMAARHLKHWTTREVPGLHCPVTLWHLLPLGPQTHGAQKPWDLRIHMHHSHSHTPILTPRLPAPGQGPAWTLEGRVGPVGLPREPLLPAALPFAPSTSQALLKREHPHRGPLPRTEPCGVHSPFPPTCPAPLESPPFAPNPTSLPPSASQMCCVPRDSGPLPWPC